MKHEETMSKAYEPFLAMMVKEFCSHKHVWDLYINSIAKIDVLYALAKVSATMAPRCLPKFVPKGVHI